MGVLEKEKSFSCQNPSDLMEIIFGYCKIWKKC